MSKDDENTRLVSEKGRSNGVQVKGFLSPKSRRLSDIKISEDLEAAKERIRRQNLYSSKMARNELDRIKPMKIAKVTQMHLFTDDSEQLEAYTHFSNKIFLKNKNASHYVFNPACYYYVWWNVFIMIVILLISFVTPVEIAWESDNERFEHSTFIQMLDSVFYISFAFDMLVQFNMPIWFKGSLVVNRRRICKRYLKSWFTVDLISTIPWKYLLAFHKETTLINLLKLFRIGRLVQSLSGSHLILQYERLKAVNYDLVTLLRIIVILSFILHSMSCGLYIVAILAEEEYDFRHVNGIENTSPFYQWIYGLYWAAMTLSTIGYGDVVLVTEAERSYAVICMMIGASSYAYLVGAIIGVVINFTREETIRQGKMGSLNRLMSSIKLPSVQRVKVRHFLADSYTRKIIQPVDYKEDLDMLSPPLVALIVRHMFRHWLPKIWWLHTTDDVFTYRLALIVQGQFYAAHDIIFKEGNAAGSLFILSSGVIVRYSENTFPGNKKYFDIDSNDNLLGKESILKVSRKYSFNAVAATHVKVW
eukprot:CAMPEP_0171457948 /NCGR_PEP_ID=MMETSP0945-20130129/3817_1 /TAXON_ID=109269 /ORGANISM="Vaucheria litorea, Strain CCMP2940" /LENGTH=532 /DNA_ID=CAMNT_0011983647 /DNA_START=108 /DNA_END=1703 /DNA_ORIENTATION=+